MQNLYRETSVTQMIRAPWRSTATSNVAARMLAGLLLTVALVVTGCGRTAPPSFTLNYENLPVSDVKRETSQVLVNVLVGMFGTPDDPYIFPEAAEVLDLRKIKLASGPTYGTADGSQRGLYRQHCVHCHGISGDGAGPTALFLNPYPRDYRRGLYKFKATQRSAKPSDADLAHVLRQGVHGTAMPSFLLLTTAEIDALVEYVKYLSVRGEVELLARSLANEDELKFTDAKAISETRALLVEQLSSITGQWAQAKDNKVETPAYPETNEQRLDVATWKKDGLDGFYKEAFALAEKKDANAWHTLGQAVFKGGRAQCMKCHGPNGLGDGSADDAIFDVWNEEKSKYRKARDEYERRRQLGQLQPGETAPEKRLYLLPEQPITPRNLRTGIYRGGRSPADLYRRVHAGINGTPMPEGKTALKPLEIWAVVDYIRGLPFDAFHRANHQTITSVHRDRN